MTKLQLTKLQIQKLIEENQLTNSEIVEVLGDFLVTYNKVQIIPKIKRQVLHKDYANQNGHDLPRIRSVSRRLKNAKAAQS